MSDETTDLALCRSEIASFIGEPEARWDSRTSTDVNSAIRKGIEAVVHGAPHSWSWLRPTYRFKTATGQRRYTLPLDFEQFIDDISFDGAEYGYSSITQKPASRVAYLYNEYEQNGVPTFYATGVESHDGTAPQQAQLVLQPTPDSEYSLVGTYQVGPIRGLDTARPYFPGGPEYRELFVAACLAQAESKFLDVKADKFESFQIALTAGIGRDHRKQPRNLGQMQGGRPRDDFRYKLATTYLGEQNV